MHFNAITNKWTSAKSGIALAGLLLVVVPHCEAQNLVPNPGFEESDTCTTMGFGFEGPQSWHSANGTAEYLQSCLPYGNPFGLPLNIITYQEPIEGNSCAGMFTYHQNGPAEYREWIMAPLLQPLEVGQTYYCNFLANAAFGGNAQYPQIWLANDKVGILFTMEDRPWYQGDPYPAPPNHAHIAYPQILTDTVGWTLVSGSFVADSAYQYVMIGQFFSNAMTDTLHLGPQGDPWFWYPRGYTLIDDVCVSLSPNGCDIGQSVNRVVDAKVMVYPNPTHDALWISNAQGADVVVFDAVGRRVFQGMVNAEVWKLPMADRARGSYVLHLERAKVVKSFKFMLID